MGCCKQAACSRDPWPENDPSALGLSMEFRLPCYATAVFPEPLRVALVFALPLP